MKQLTAYQKELVADVADDLGVPADSLEALMRFETAGTFDPQIKNPGSSARGLIQFTDATAQGMGYDDAADLVAHFPDFESQLRGPVFDFLSVYRPFPDDQSLFMTVFRPTFRNVPVDTPFPDFVQKANPGIKTPADYLKKAWALSGRNLPATGGTAAIILGLAAGAAGFFF